MTWQWVFTVTSWGSDMEYFTSKTGSSHTSQDKLIIMCVMLVISGMPNCETSRLGKDHGKLSRIRAGVMSSSRGFHCPCYWRPSLFALPTKTYYITISMMCLFLLTGTSSTWLWYLLVLCSLSSSWWHGRHLLLPRKLLDCLYHHVGHL